VWWLTLIILTTPEVEIRRNWVQAGPDLQDPIRKIAKAKRAGSVVQGVEHLPSKHKTLSSNPNTEKVFLLLMINEY
jgi:hypothetical protein